MKKAKALILTVTFLLNLGNIPAVFAQNTEVEEKQISQEEIADNNPYIISLYEPTYIMPFSYVSSFSSAAQADAPDDTGLEHIETKFQFSVKTAIWKNFFNYKNSLNLAYTQLSFWQVYNKSSFFRESNYQPEIFFENTLDHPLGLGWDIHFLNLGLIHDSNGRGGTYERSWNRIYGELIFTKTNWMVSVRPWYVINNSSLENNRDIADFLGYERVVIAYKFHQQTLSLSTYNLEHLGTRASFQGTYSFPIVRKFRGYVQLFSGYGQSLIDYNHYSNSASVGIALNDWI